MKSLTDQVHDKILGLLLNQIAHCFTDDPCELPPDLEQKYDHVINVKISYEAEIIKVLGDESEMLDRHRLLVLAEEITLEELYNVDHGGIDEVCCYVKRFPEELKKWHDHLLTLLD